MTLKKLIQINNVSVTRNNQKILHDISFDVNYGEHITIVGPNGAGKTTLLKCIMGLMTPNSGTITVDSELTMGYVPQQFNVAQTLPITAGDFLQLHKRISAGRLADVAHQTEITHVLRSQLSTLSGGQLQRLLVARSLIDMPDILIFDEAAKSLDMRGQIDFYALIERLKQHYDISVIMVSHDLHIVMANTQQVICLDSHLCCSGTPSTVIKDPAFTRLFGEQSQGILGIYEHQEHVHPKECKHDV